MTTRRTSLSASLVGLALIFAASGISQVTTANFYAIVNDSTGAVIPGATVTMIHESTNATTTKITDERGEASFPFLRIGRYRLTIEASGFRRFQSTGLELVSGQNVRESYALQLGDITETVEVTGSLPQLNTVAAEQRETLTQRQVEELPLANRNFQNLLELGTGISTAGSGGVRMNGLGRSGLKLTVDGTDATGNPESPSSGLYQGDTNYIQTLSIEAIQEVQVTKGVTPAEFGHQLAGNVNLITKSGTNEWHGSLFENFRAEDLNAKERRQATKSPFTFNQFGGSVGGPILRDRAFIFGTYEGYREVAFSTVQGDVPTQKFRDEAIAAQPVYADMLARFKFPNQAFDPDADVGRWIGVGRRFRRDNHFVLKGDVRVGDSGNLAVTWVRARPYFLNPEDEFIGNGRESRGENDRLTLTYLTGGPAWTSETRFGRNWTNVEREDLFFSQGIEEETFGGRRLPHMGVDGLFSGGGSEIFIIFGPTYSFEQKVAITSGEHSIKFGGIWSSRRVGHNNVENVQFAYASKEDFFANIPRRVQATFGVNRFNSSPNDWGLFAQDDWRVTPNLVINLGVRYDYFDNFVPFPANPGETVGLYNRALLDSQFNLGPIRDPENPYEPDGGVNIGPRVGFSYNLGGRSETVVRGGFSVMFSPMPLDDPAETAANSPQVPFRVRFGREDAIDLGLTFPDYNDDLRKVIEAEAVERIGDFFDPQIQAPYSMNLYLGVQRSLTPTLMIESAFVGNRGVK